MKLSLMTLGDLVTDPVTGDRETPASGTRVVEPARSADQAASTASTSASTTG